MEDIPTLARHLVAKYAAETKKGVRDVSLEAMALLRAHSWPGNVRELANVIERSVVLCSGDRIGPADLALSNSSQSVPPLMTTQPGATDYHSQVKAHKQALIRSALRQARGNQTKAAELLGLQRTYLVKLLRAFGMRENGGPER
jgi:DNA-binding NtrC family response regulator